LFFFSFLQIIVAVVWPVGPSSPKQGMSMALSVEELAELLAYEEVDPDGLESTEPYPPQYHRSIRGMHHYIPSNPFKATIRIHRSVPMVHLQSTRGRAGTDLVPTIASQDNPGSCLVDYMGTDSPASFPPTPFSRANVMNKSHDHVASVMFAARDRLRLETQSVSRDEYTRMMAMEAQTSGQFAVFDPRQSSPGVALSCGNHCAIKVGKGLCCCCCSMVPVRPNAYVYFEFSVMVSSAKTPTLGIGLSPQDCPMNVMVGSWPKSQGLYNDGQMLIGSHWYQSTNGKRIEAGSTVGMLVYIPSSTAPLPGDLSHAPALLTRNDHGNSTILEVSGEHTADNSMCNSTNQINASFLGSIMQGFSRSNSLDPDESYGLALSDNSSSGESSKKASRQNSPEKSKGKHAEADEAVAAGGDGKGETGKFEEEPAGQRKMLFHFTVNGEPILYPVEASQCLQEIVASNTPLYPTVSLFSEETRVWCRFCEADVVYRSRAAIGAPPGVRVYCLDGTLLLQEGDE
jgi:hypothetical protein